MRESAVELIDRCQRIQEIGGIIKQDDVDKLVSALTSAVNRTSRLEEEVEALESLRPHWAQGYTSDSQAAQASTAAKSEMWDLLEVDNQTEAMMKLKRLSAISKSLDEIVSQSEGVAGFHLNGSVATWEELNMPIGDNHE